MTALKIQRGKTGGRGGYISHFCLLPVKNTLPVMLFPDKVKMPILSAVQPKIVPNIKKHVSMF